jgi:hypothetical protein
MARRWKWLILIVCGVPFLISGFDRLMTIHWVGGTDLDIDFTVTDAATGAPIPGARVQIQSEGGFYAEDYKQEFVLVADAGGVASKECRRSMCFGTRSGLGFTDTFVVHLPWWRFRAVAEGYEPCDWVELDVPKYIRQARRAGPGRAKLIVPVSLHKRHADPGAVPDRGGIK